MKLRRGEPEIVYMDKNGNIVDQPEMSGNVQAMSALGEAAMSETEYTKVTRYPWLDLEGKPVAYSYSPHVMAVSITPANADKRRVEYLNRLREALQRISKPDATKDDIAAALALQIEYLEFMSKLD